MKINKNPQNDNPVHFSDEAYHEVLTLLEEIKKASKPIFARFTKEQIEELKHMTDEDMQYIEEAVKLARLDDSVLPEDVDIEMLETDLKYMKMAYRIIQEMKKLDEQLRSTLHIEEQKITDVYATLYGGHIYNEETRESEMDRIILRLKDYVNQKKNNNKNLK